MKLSWGTTNQDRITYIDGLFQSEAGTSGGGGGGGLHFPFQQLGSLLLPILISSLYKA